VTLVRDSGPFDPGPLVAGRPLPWLALQALSVTAVGAAVLLVVGLVRDRGTAAVETGSPQRREPVAAGGRGPGTVRRPAAAPRPTGERVRLALLLAAAAAFVPWALYWGLLLP